MANYAQTFYIHSDKVQGAEYVTVPEVLISIKSYPKPSTARAANLPDPAVTVFIAEMTDDGAFPDPGAPVRGAFQTMSRTGMLEARKNPGAGYKKNSWIPFVFMEPAILKVNKVYAIIIAFEGDSEVYSFEGSFSEYEQNKLKRLGRTEPTRFKYKKLMK